MADVVDPTAIAPVAETPVTEQPAEAVAAPPPEPQTQEDIDKAIMAKAVEAIQFTPDDDAAPTDTAPAAPEQPQADQDDILAVAAQEAREAREMKANLRAMHEKTTEAQTAATEVLDLAKSNPVAFMERYGGDRWYKKATDQLVKTGLGEGEKPKSEFEQLSAKFDALKAELDNRDTAGAEQAYLGQLGQAMQDPKYALIAQDPTAVSELRRFVSAYKTQYGEYLPTERVLDNLLGSQVERLKKLRQSDAWQAALGETTTETPQQPPTAKPPAEITNAQPVRGIPPQTADFDPLDEEARMQAAISSVKFNPE